MERQSRKALKIYSIVQSTMEPTRRRWLRQAGIGLGLFIFLAAVSTAFYLAEEYAHYAALVDARLAAQALHQPAGIYAAPRRVSVGQRLNSVELAERLLRVGYLEGSRSTEFAAGNFMLKTGEVTVQTNAFARLAETPASARINFAGNTITQIKDTETGRKLQTLLLPAEMLTADFNTKKQTRRATSFAELPAVLVKALCAIEDRRFFEHPGVDWRGILRAAWTNAKHGEIREGGSTITQQLIKNEFLTPDRTWDRKLAEALMALALERRLTKQQIFTLYCERVYLGHSGLTAVYGFQQAAQVFLGKELPELTLSEAAFLAGLVKAPNRYAPHARPAEARARRDLVLTAMVEGGSISATEAAAGKSEELALLPPQQPGAEATPYFIDYVNRELAWQQFTEEEGARLRVETTLDADLQQAANQVIATQLDRIHKLVAKRYRHARPEAALIALDPQSGEILAMVGGSDYATSQLNRVTDARRQPGSVFKPVVYAAALSRGISPSTTFLNAPHEISFGFHAVYRPQNFGRSYSYRPVTLRESLVRSLNVVAVDAAMEIGLGHVAALAEGLGLPRPEAYPSLALGAFEATPLDVARAYTAFANRGVRVDPLAIRAIKSHQVTLSHGEAVKSGVLPATVAYLVTDALAEVVSRGTGTRARPAGYRGPVAGKTGTSRDAWFVGYTPKLLVVVWVGFDDHRDLGLTGGSAAAPIWADFFQRALALRPDLRAKAFPRPAGLEMVEIDPVTGMLANEYCPYRQRMLMTSYLVPAVCLNHQAPPPIYQEILFAPELVLTQDNPPTFHPTLVPNSPPIMLSEKARQTAENSPLQRLWPH